MNNPLIPFEKMERNDLRALYSILSLESKIAGPRRVRAAMQAIQEILYEAPSWKWHKENRGNYTQAVHDWLDFIGANHLLDNPKKIKFGDEVYVQTILERRYGRYERDEEECEERRFWYMVPPKKPFWGIVVGVRTLQSGRCELSQDDHGRYFPGPFECTFRFRAIQVAHDLYKNPVLIPASLHYDLPGLPGKKRKSPTAEQTAKIANEVAEALLGERPISGQGKHLDLSYQPGDQPTTPFG